jgi:hypothetical protein
VRLVALEVAQRLGRAGDALGALDPLVDGPLVAGELCVELGLMAGDLLGPRLADGQGLVPDDHAHPRALGRHLDAVEPAKVDLQRSLDSLVGVVGAQRDAARDPLQALAVRAHHRRDASVRALGLRGQPSLLERVSRH